MTDRLVNLQDHLVGREQEVARPARAVRRRQQLHRLLGDELRALRETPSPRGPPAPPGGTARGRRRYASAFPRPRWRSPRASAARRRGAGANDRRRRARVASRARHTRGRLPNPRSKGRRFSRSFRRQSSAILSPRDTAFHGRRTGLSYSPERGARTSDAASTRPRWRVERAHSRARSTARRRPDSVRSEVAAYPMPPPS